MVECLKCEGVSTVFGYPGVAIAPFYDCLLDSGVRHVLTRSEQGAGHAANGYARMTDRPGVCVATSGPGATNLLTAIATAYSDSIPMVAITGQVAVPQLGHDVFQEVDITGASNSFTKYSYLVKSAQDIPRVFQEAFHIASTGRKGPVLIDMPVDVQKQMVAFSYPKEANIRGYKPRTDGHPMQIRKVTEAISKSKRPLICVGGGAFLSNSVEQIRAFCEKTNIPAVSTMMGVSVFPYNNPHYFGVVGQSGLKTANAAVHETDLIILIGARVGDRAITQPAHLEVNNTTIVHIDIDSAEIGKNLGATIPLVGNARQVLEQLMEQDILSEWGDWNTRLSALRADEQQTLQARATEPGALDPHRFIRELCRALPGGSVFVADVGRNQIWSHRNYCADGRFLTSGGMGTMGYSIPAALGASMACPEKTVVAVCGDGSFQMSMNELATIRQHGACVKVIVMNNGILGLVKELQDRVYNGRASGIDLSGSPNIGGIAAAYDMPFFRADSTEAAVAAVKQLLESPCSGILECIVSDKEASV